MGRARLRRRRRRALHEADPALALTFAMTCPECGAAFDQLFDPAAYLWAEIDDMSRDLLGQVILLARSFGWSEAAILAMPRAPRALPLPGWPRLRHDRAFRPALAPFQRTARDPASPAPALMRTPAGRRLPRRDR